MQKLVLCGKVTEAESPKDYDLCSGQSSFDFLSCAINRNNNNNCNNAIKNKISKVDTNKEIKKVKKTEFANLNHDENIAVRDYVDYNKKNEESVTISESELKAESQKRCANLYDTLNESNRKPFRTSLLSTSSPELPSPIANKPDNTNKFKTRDDQTSCWSAVFEEDTDDGDDDGGHNSINKSHFKSHTNKTNKGNANSKVKNIPCYYNKNCQFDEEEDSAMSNTSCINTRKKSQKIKHGSISNINNQNCDDSANCYYNGSFNKHHTFAKSKTETNFKRDCNENENDDNCFNDDININKNCDPSTSFLTNGLKIQEQLDTGRGDEKICYLQDLSDRFNIIRKIGNGTFGSVFLAIRLKDQKKVALKKLPKEKTKIEDFCIEFRYGRLFSDHPGILETSSTAYVTNSWFVLVHEYASMSDLLRLVPPRVGLPEVSVKSIMRQLVGAVKFIHEAGVVHRDLKLENILVFQNQIDDQDMTRIKLGDFGVARKVGTKVCKVCEGTTYTPPEICSLSRHSHYRVLKSADVWSAGVLVFCLMTGSFPWQQADLNKDPLFQSFARWQCKKVTTVPEHWTRFSPSLHKFFHRFLNLKPEKRPDITSLSRYLGTRWSNSSGSLSSGSRGIRDVEGSDSTLACASSQPPSSLTSAEQDESYHPDDNHHKYGSLKKVGNHRHVCNCYGNKFYHFNYHCYKNEPFKTSGALHSPIFDNELANSSSQNEAIANFQSKTVSLHRCHHHHFNLSDFGKEKEQICSQHDQLPNGTFSDFDPGQIPLRRAITKEIIKNDVDDNDIINDNINNKSDILSNGVIQRTDPETILRLDRVNRWLMMMGHT